MCPKSTPFSHTLTASEAQHGETGHNMIETISMIKQNCALHMHVYADFMHFVFFLKLYTMCPCMNQHFGNMHNHPVNVGSWFTAQGSTQFRIFRTPVHDSWVEWFNCFMSYEDILVIGICDDTCNMLVYRRT